MTNWMNDMMNPQKWMTDAMGTAQNTYEYGQRNMQMWRDQAQNAMDTTMKNFQHMNEEWQKAYQTFMGNARKSQEMCFNAMQEGLHNMNNMYTPNTTNTPAPSKQK